MNPREVINERIFKEEMNRKQQLVWLSDLRRHIREGAAKLQTCGVKQFYEIALHVLTARLLATSLNNHIRECDLSTPL
jgi:hypothetical protein